MSNVRPRGGSPSPSESWLLWGDCLDKHSRIEMLDHASLGVADLERSRHFYDAVLRPLGLVRTVDFEERGSDYGTMAGSLGIELTITVEKDTTPSPGMHLCFRAPD